MLPSYADCARRAAAKQYGDDVKAAGFELRELDPSVGAALGTSVHAGAALMLQAKRDTGEITQDDEVQAQELAIDAFQESTQNGATWDDTTPNARTAQFQIRRLTYAYAAMARSIEPVLIEFPMQADAGGDFELTGTLDLVTASRELRDLKSGALPRPYQAQLGAYSLLLKSNHVAVSDALIDWLPRAPQTKPQEPVDTQRYEVATCEKAAYATINFIKRDLTEFRRSGDPWAFPANNMSMMCTDRFCPAHSTRFCDMWKVSR